MGTVTLRTVNRMMRTGESNEVSNEKLVRLIESSLWDLVADADDYGNLAEVVRAHLARSATARTGILEYIVTIRVSAVSDFVAADHFKVDISANARVKIAWISKNFTDHFLGKIERDVSATSMRVYRLLESPPDDLIIVVLGRCRDTMLAHLCKLLEKQPNGENGRLLTNRKTNIFYIRDIAGALWAVDACWNGGGWFVGASSVEGPSGWFVGSQVFSC
ncbi:MAG: hypothetical protein AAB518_03825 [Patescibacteria group bacterium]